MRSTTVRLPIQPSVFLRFYLLFTLLLTILLIPTYTVQAASQSFEASADARVDAEAPNENFGGNSSFAADGEPQMEAFLRFRVDDLDGSVRRATLRVWAVTGTGTLPDVALADNDWSERNITWDNRPKSISDRKSFGGGTSAERWVEFDVSSFVRGEGTYTFVLSTDSGDRLTMSSRESSNEPQLIVEVGESARPQPQPTSPPNPGPTAPPAPAPPSSGNGSTWYVQAGASSGGDGETSSRAWNELNRIQWSRIRPGDTIYIRRGTYRETLDVNANGSDGKPIRILFEPGTALFGGRSTPLPSCGQNSYSDRAGRDAGIELGDSSYILLDAQRWDGLKIYGWQRGVNMDDAHHITIRNVEITDNGIIERDGSGWSPASHGVKMGGVRSILFDRMNFHDNGADGIHAYENIADVTLRDTWLHNDRGWQFNGCGHPDGLQINGGYSGKNITFQRVVSGPGVYHTILSNGGGENWRFEDVLAFEPITSPLACRGNCRDFSFNRITSDGKDGRLNFELSGSGHRITNSLVTNGTNKLPGDVSFDNNYQHDLDGDRVGSSRDPQYRDPESGDYTPQGDVNGAGSRLTSAKRLMANVQQSTTNTNRQAAVGGQSTSAQSSDNLVSDALPAGAEVTESHQDAGSIDTGDGAEQNTDVNTVYLPLASNE